MNDIARLNDQFRRGDLTLGQFIVTGGVDAVLSAEKLLVLINRVQAFNDFTPENDPHRQHDLGQVRFEGVDYFWQIDYYNPTYTYRSSAPASPNATRRVLTLMRDDEW